MKTRSTYTGLGWDYTNIWDICEGLNYPRLQSQIPVGDFACPNGVGSEDLILLTTNWLRMDCSILNQYCDDTDMNVSGSVDLADLAVFAGNWLSGS
jgi:hypothetical protein